MFLGIDICCEEEGEVPLLEKAKETEKTYSLWVFSVSLGSLDYSKDCVKNSSDNLEHETLIMR